MIGYDDPMGPAKLSDQVPKEITPGGLSMQAKYRVSLTLIYIMHPESGCCRKMGGKWEGAIKSLIERYHVGMI
jgi:hypothetical protein